MEQIKRYPYLVAAGAAAAILGFAYLKLMYVPEDCPLT
jgi:hypothetical protein